ncbi:PilW family protein [Shewanella sp. UCD-KL12]|uniref:PilW family protein n=1 Tax=Shewanella sp. UCD-KL12 TaxID=1917163 RepID=UPI0009707E40|nr:prepilin-type N-terminal cleavage/methylation domain-containing protein [Shewanella sp. UCD-KL12]
MHVSKSNSALSKGALYNNTLHKSASRKKTLHNSRRQSSKLVNRSKGFTLVEVMIAGVILIMTVTAMTMVYRTAALSSGKASDNVEFSASVGMIFNTIQGHVRGGNATEAMSGDGHLAGVDYRWSTELITKKGAAEKFDIDEGDWVEQPVRFYLWNVELIVSQGSKERVYNYKELSWER